MRLELLMQLGGQVLTSKIFTGLYVITSYKTDCCLLECDIMSGGEVQTSEIFAGEHCRMCHKILVIC